MESEEQSSGGTWGRWLAGEWHRVARLPRQITRGNPFEGDCLPTRVPLFAPWSGRPTVPFPYRGNYREPIRLLETYFWAADNEQGSGRHNRYLEVPGISPVLVTRDPGIIRAITTATGDRPGQFDRDTLPSTGIARATGPDTLLYANGPTWRKQRKISASPFGKTSLFQVDRFGEFEQTFRGTVTKRVELLRQVLAAQRSDTLQVQLEPEIKAVMLEMLVNNFFGASLAYDDIRNTYVPALQHVIDHIVRDTVTNRFGIPIWRLPGFSPQVAKIKQNYGRFDELTDAVLAQRASGKGLWRQFKSDAPDAALRSNIKVFLAGALEATTSYATWAIAHLARHPAAQQRVYEEVKDIEAYSPESLDGAKYFTQVLDETLRLTPSLYFLPRRATDDIWIEAADGRRMKIPRGTHILLDVWHANRHEDHWGVGVSGYPADEFAPERWDEFKRRGTHGSKDLLHFGFGHGPRVCPGKHLGQLEVGLVVGAIVKLFRFRALTSENPAIAGVSTKPADGTLVELSIRE
jgi:cytochrome P450